MIVKNEEETLERCLNSAKNLFDEIIIVDTGSTDATIEIAKKFTKHVYSFEWINDFSAARNFSFNKATKDYIMWLDADDVIEESEEKKLRQLKATMSKDIDMVKMYYHVHFDKNGMPTTTSQRERLIKREKQFRWQDPVHECIPLRGNVHSANIAISHKKTKKEETSDRNLNIYLSLEESSHIFTPRQLYYFARELKDHRMFERALVYYSKFIEGKLGWSEDNINACRDMSYCYNSLNQPDNALAALTNSFRYDSPRAEVLCDIGYHYKSIQNYALAARWFLLATKAEKPESYCFLSENHWGYIPYIELCVCYDKLGDIEKAMHYNQLAGKIKPESEAVKLNKLYFSSLQKQN